MAGIGVTLRAEARQGRVCKMCKCYLCNKSGLGYGPKCQSVSHGKAVAGDISHNISQNLYVTQWLIPSA